MKPFKTAPPNLFYEYELEVPEQGVIVLRVENIFTNQATIIIPMPDGTYIRMPIKINQTTQ